MNEGEQPQQDKPKKPIPRHIIVKLLEAKGQEEKLEHGKKK